MKPTALAQVLMVAAWAAAGPIAASGGGQAAIDVWLPRAHEGDPVAQYNMALAYRAGRGVPADPVQAERWMREAARRGLVPAVRALKEEAVRPGDDRTIGEVLGPQQWVLAQDPDTFTLQLASSRNRQLIEKYLTENGLQGRAGYYRSLRQGEPWYALIYGSFPTAEAAAAAVDRLPPELRKWSPWVRRMRDIHRVMMRDAARLDL